MGSTSLLAAQHVLSHFHRLPRTHPMFVALQGPQGSGKTHLARSLVSILANPPHCLRLAVLSVDDLYLTHSGLLKLAADNPENKLWKGRGQPGSHDLKLGTDILGSLQSINAERTGELNVAAIPQVILPAFDKSKFNGEGDRAAVGIPVSPPIDIVIFEGWCVGFYPLDKQELDDEWLSVRAKAESTPGSILHRAMEGVRKEDIEAVNEALGHYVKHWYSFLEVFVQIAPPAHAPYEYIYSWRLQQEHGMKAANGGIGMTDEQVVSFVDRYIPGYIFFSKGVTRGGSVEGRPPWEGKGLCITINQERTVVETRNF